MFFSPYQPAPQLRKDCPRWQTDLKDLDKLEQKCPMARQYGPESLLLGASAPLLEREGTHHKVLLM